MASIRVRFGTRTVVPSDPCCHAEMTHMERALRSAAGDPELVLLRRGRRAHAPQRTRAQPSTAPAQRPPAGGGSPDAQNVLVRRMVAVIVAGLACSSGCSSTAATTAGTRTRSRTTTSRSPTSAPSRARPARRSSRRWPGGAQSPQELYTQINSLKATPRRRSSRPGAQRAGRHVRAQQSLLIALELRRDALRRSRWTSGPRSATRARPPTARSRRSPGRTRRSTRPTSSTTRASSRSS